jgi:hypothetical protein
MPGHNPAAAVEAFLDPLREAIWVFGIDGGVTVSGCGVLMV